MEYLWKMYQHVMQEIEDTIVRDSWYRNEGACFNPFMCDYLDIKKSGGVSPKLYTVRDKPEPKNDGIPYRIVEEEEGSWVK